MLNQDSREFIQLLHENDVRYLVVGGYAVAIHGYPRYTKGIDLWIWMDAENAQRVIVALAQFGFASLDLQVEDFLVADQVIQLGYPPARIDLLTTLPGVDFEACYANRVEIDVNGLLVKFIDLANLKKSKRASGRLQDLADLENLE